MPLFSQTLEDRFSHVEAQLKDYHLKGAFNYSLYQGRRRLLESGTAIEGTEKKYKESRTSSLQEMNDGGACLESFKFSCVVYTLEY